jgi:hypothetical protein
MAYFDGRLSSIEPVLRQTNTEMERLKIEINALHDFFDTLGIEKWDHVRGGELLLAQRLEKMLEAPTLWEPVKKESEQGG